MMQHRRLVSLLVLLIVSALAGRGVEATSRLRTPLHAGTSLQSLNRHTVAKGDSSGEQNTPVGFGSSSVRSFEESPLPKPLVRAKRGAGVASSTLTLAKSIIGMSVLSLPSGLAYVSDDRSAIIPAAFMCLFFGALAAHSFSTIGQVCETHQVHTYSDAYRATISNTTAKIVPVFTTITCLLNTLACSIMIGDSFSDIFRSLNAPAQLRSRMGALLAITVVVLAPLCSLQSLKSLAPLSLLGLFGTLFSAIVMGVRFFDGSYSYSNMDDLHSGMAGKFLSRLDLSYRPSFNVFRRNTGEWTSLLTPAAFVLLSMLNNAYVSHYHAPRIYAELEDKSMKVFTMISRLSFGVATTLFIFMMSVGYLTFGGSSNSFILNNYASSDTLATASRVAVGISLVTGYPILFTALKDGIADLLSLSRPADQQWHWGAGVAATASLLGAITAVAIQLRDVSFLVSFAGALCGSMLMFVFPALMGLSVQAGLQRRAHSELLDLEYSLPYWEKVSPDANTLAAMDRLNKQMFWIRVNKMINYITLTLGSAMSVIGVLVCVLREIGIDIGIAHH